MSSKNSSTASGPPPFLKGGSLLISFSRKAPLGGSCRACEAERGLHYNLAFSTYFKLLAIGSNDNVTMVEGRQHLRAQVLQATHHIFVRMIINLPLATANQGILGLHLADEFIN